MLTSLRIYGYIHQKRLSPTNAVGLRCNATGSRDFRLKIFLHNVPCNITRFIQHTVLHKTDRWMDRRTGRQTNDVTNE